MHCFTGHLRFCSEDGFEYCGRWHTEQRQPNLHISCNFIQARTDGERSHGNVDRYIKNADTQETKRLNDES